MNRKYNLETCIQIAAERGGKCLSVIFNSVTDKLLWECKSGHKWSTSLHKIKNGKQWCAICNGQAKHTIEECKTYAETKNGECLSTSYIDNKHKLIWRCNYHDIIWESTFHNIKNSHTWCSACSREKMPPNKLSLQDCIDFATSKNGQCLSDIYIDMKTPLSWQCDKKHIWQARFDNIKNGDTWCPSCKVKTSKPQKAIQDFISSLNYQFLSNDRIQIKPYELDVYIFEKQIAIEHCGLIYHSEKYYGEKAKYRHLKKFQSSQEKKIRLITIFGDEWIYKQEQVKGYLKAILGKAQYKVDARKCEIRVVGSSEAKQFHDTNHIQGHANGKHIGLYFDDTLVALSTFSKPNASRNAHKNNDDKIELTRYTAKINHSIRGGLGKLLAHFIRNNVDIKEVVSYSDNRWSNGNIYKTLGFELKNTGSPSYFYFKEGTQKRFHRYNFTKHKALELFGGDKEKDTEWDIMSRNGYDRIWDCGSSKWVLQVRG